MTPARPLSSLALVLALAASACLENDEEITVRPDGSVHVKVSAKGDVLDLAQGYAVPLGGPWRPASPSAELWLRTVGETTGGADVLRRVADERALGDPQSERTLAAEADFPSVEALPARYADPGDPYADAYLERSASLRVLRRGPRTVYVLERTLHARPYGRQVFERMIEDDEHDDDVERLERFLDGSLPDKELEAVRKKVVGEHASYARAFVQEAFRGLFERGSAAVPAAAVEGLLARVEARVEALFALSRLQALPREREALGAAWTALYASFRDALREEVARTLDEAGVAPQERNAVAFALEREFTVYDHTMDLADETFRVALTLPGELVNGNYDDADGSTAEWRVDGFALLTGDVTLRAISVVE